MSANLIALGVALVAQVAGGGRYDTPPVSNPATEFGALFADEPTDTSEASDKAPPVSDNGTSSPDAEAPATSPRQPLPREQAPPDMPPASAYRNSAVPTATTPPIETRSAAEPSELIEAILAKPAGSQLAGTPIRLREVVQGAGSRADQTARIEAYWDLCAATADYHLALVEQQELAHLQRRQPATSAALRTTGKALEARVATAERAARAAQLRLANLMGRSTRSNLPLPKDLPHCGEYITKYEEKFGTGGPAEAAELHALLPLQHAEIQSAADAVARSEQWLDSIANNRVNSNGSDVVRALKLLALQRRAFVHLVDSYNRQIARYTEIATPGRLATGRLVAMLILTDRAPAVAQRTSDASRTQPGSETQPRREVPQTFVTPMDEPPPVSATPQLED